MNNPSLPSAKPARALLLTISGLSISMLIAGLGLGANAIAIYQGRAQDRLTTKEQLTALEQQAQINQRSAQLQRGYDAPVWDASAVYDPSATYAVDGVRRVPVPVLIGPELDTAVCIGSMGPDGFVQNINDPLCLGY